MRNVSKNISIVIVSSFIKEGDFPDTVCDVLMALSYVWAGKMTAYMKLKSGGGIGELDDYRCAPHVEDLFFMVREGRAGIEGFKARESPREKQQRDRRD